MSKALIFIAVLSLMISPMALWAEKPALTVVFNCPIGEEKTPSHSEVVAAVVEQLNNTGKFEALVFNPDLPTIARAVMERRITQQAVKSPEDPIHALQIAGGLGAQYGLLIEGSVVENRVDVNLELLKVEGADSFQGSALSTIPEAGPRSATNRSNAVSNALSSAISQLMIAAFGEWSGLQTMQKPGEKASAEETPAIQPSADPAKPSSRTVEPAVTRDVADEYNKIKKQVDAYIAKGDLRNAIVELKKAVNLEPDKAPARIKLVGLYTDLGMTAQALDECNRTLQFDPDNVELHHQIVKMYMASGAVDQAAEHCREIIRLEPRNVQAHLSLGDISWNQGKVDDAMSEYEKAINLDPNNPAPHERLQRLCTARKMHLPAIEHLLQSRVLSQEGEQTASQRYQLLGQIVQDEFHGGMGKLESARQDYENDRITREEYYQEVVGVTSRIEALSSLLSTQTAPTNYRQAHPHGLLAASLLAQASGCIVSHLETERKQYLDQARLLQGEARTEMKLFTESISKLVAGKSG